MFKLHLLTILILTSLFIACQPSESCLDTEYWDDAAGGCVTIP